MREERAHYVQQKISGAEDRISEVISEVEKEYGISIGDVGEDGIEIEDIYQLERFAGKRSKMIENEEEQKKYVAIIDFGEIYFYTHLTEREYYEYRENTGLIK